MRTENFAGVLVGCLAGLTVFSMAGLVTVTHYFTDFSSEDFRQGPFVEADGWRNVFGNVEVVSEPKVRGSSAIRIFGTSPASVLQRILPMDDEAETVFYDLFVRPAAGAGIHQSTRVSPGRASVGFVRGKTSNEARLVARDLSQQTGWLDVGLRLPTDFTGQSEAYYRLTLRLDRGENVIDIYLNGRLVAYDLAIDGATIGDGLPFRVLGSMSGDTFVDDFYAGETNPLFDDPLGIGIPANWLVLAGLDPASVDRYQKLEDGQTVIEAFFAEERRGQGAEVDDLKEFVPERLPSSRGLMIFTPLERKEPFDLRPAQSEQGNKSL